MKTSICILALILPALLFGQKSRNINKYSIGLEVEIGHSFPNFSAGQTNWKASFYPTGGLNVLFVNRINKTWISELGFGITAYALSNRGPQDHYVLDFASPTVSTGISYNFRYQKNKEHFIRLTSGFQTGYQGNFVDVYETYSVSVEGKHKLYPFIRPEIGIRKYFKQKMKGARYKTCYEFGTFFRYNLNTLGIATIRDDDVEVRLEPRGNIMGAYFKVLFPAGKKRLRIKQEQTKELSPVIYNPRFFK